jgi:hypothetical protein
MSRKGKSHEINDIIDTAFTETDYSHGNGFYDEIRDYNRPRNTGGFRSLTQTQTPTTADTKTEKNMFLKYSQNDTSVKNNDTPTDKQMMVDDANFPSLGGAKSKTAASTATAPAKQPVCLNFKKIVTTPLAIPTENANANANANSNSNLNTKEQSSSRNSYHNKYNSFLMYHHIKDNSEKIARYRMENDYSSDDDY